MLVEARPSTVSPGLARVRPPAGLVLAAALVGAVTLLPLGFMAVRIASIGGDQVVALLFRPRVGELLLNTGRLVVVATLASAIIGLGAAWLTERTAIPGRAAWAVLMALPLTVPAFVMSYSWVSLTPAVQGFAGAVMVVTLSYFPFIYLPVAAVLRNMDPALEEVARSQGCGMWKTFWRVTLPHARPALIGGALIVSLHLLAEFGAFDLLRFSTFTTAIYNEYQLTFDGPAASMLASVLAALSLLLLVAEMKVRGRAFASRVGAGTARRVVRYDLGRWTPCALAALAAVLLLALGVPLGTLAYWLIRGGAGADAFMPVMQATVTSLGLSLEAAVLTTACAVPVALLAVRFPGRLANGIERSTYVSQALPGIIIALGLIVVAVHYLRPVYQTTGLLLVAYGILSLPFAVVAIRAALAQVSPRLEDVARSLGCPPFKVLFRVTLPIIAPGLAAGATLVFLATVTELTATLLLAPTGTQTLAMQVWSNTDQLAYAAAAPYAALTILISALPTYLFSSRFGAIAS
ncbi:MAG TPA: iron ABC transporter permease [Chloroflexota bacterium]|nr:iron ABC transporter permease [Chloroflexota bacterium]